MRVPRFDLSVRRLPADRPLTDRERELAKALPLMREFTGEQYKTLRSALRALDGDAVHEAAVDLTATLKCDHAPCECIQQKQDVDDCVAIASFTSGGEDGPALLARAFKQWCWDHARASSRTSDRERPCSEEPRSDAGAGSARNSLDQWAASRALHAPDSGCVERCEESVEGTDRGSVLEVIFTRSGCSEREANALVFIDSRPKRTFGDPVDPDVRKAASRARAKVREYLASLGIYGREDLAVAIEEGVFLEEFAA